MTNQKRIPPARKITKLEEEIVARLRKLKDAYLETIARIAELKARRLAKDGK